MDYSGIVYSDYQYTLKGAPLLKPMNGSLKGWLVDLPLKNIAIIAKHCGPSLTAPFNQLKAFDGKQTYTRTIIEIEYPEYDMGKETLSGNRHGSDIAICKLDKPFPETIKRYKFATKYKKEEKSKTKTSHGISEAKIYFNEDPWIFGTQRKNIFIAGDSGLPWFIGDEVVTHTTKGINGEGPMYSHPSIYNDLIKKIFKLSKL